MIVFTAWPVCSGRWTMYTDRFSASSHTASVLWGKNDGGAEQPLVPGQRRGCSR
jgi:hypothetical protein